MIYKFVVWNHSFEQKWMPARPDSFWAPIPAGFADDLEDANMVATRFLFERGAESVFIFQRLDGAMLSPLNYVGFLPIALDRTVALCRDCVADALNKCAAYLREHHPDIVSINPQE